MSAHTPGPWNVRRARYPNDGQYDWGIGADVDGRPKCIAEAFGRVDSDLMTPAEANARLIAAAPDMLAVLEWMDRKGGLGLDVHERIKAAIAKATT